jgi:hypothetical protein
VSQFCGSTGKQSSGHSSQLRELVGAHDGGLRRPRTRTVAGCRVRSAAGMFSRRRSCTTSRSVAVSCANASWVTSGIGDCFLLVGGCDLQARWEVRTPGGPLLLWDCQRVGLVDLVQERLVRVTGVSSSTGISHSASTGCASRTALGGENGFREAKTSLRLALSRHGMRWITEQDLPDCLRRDADRDVARASSSIGRAADF